VSCALPSPLVSAANVRFLADAAQVCDWVSTSFMSCGLVQCAGRAQFCGRYPWSATKQLLKAGLVRSSIKPKGSRLPLSIAAYEP
jgi:hypothetical protein